MENFRILANKKITDRGEVFYNPTGRKLSAWIDSKGYPRVNIEGLEFSTHRIIWGLFGPYPAGGLDINHKNGIKTDNRIENLEAVTRSENIIHAHRTGLHPGSRNVGKLSPSEVKIIFKSARSLRELAKIYGVHHSIIYRIKKRIKY